MRWYLVGVAALAAAAIMLLVLLPDEKTLGPVIKVVFLHGALVQAGLLAFLTAGGLGLAWLILRRGSLWRWCAAAQETALILWTAYVLSSMASTWLAWGQVIAWDEPRVRASAYVLILAVACWLLVRWVNDRTFTALANVAVAGGTWYLIKGAAIVRHPLNPIGDSSSTAYKLFALALLAVVLALAALLTRWLHTRHAAPVWSA